MISLIIVIKKNQYITIKTICIDKHSASFGNKMSSKIFTFSSFDKEFPDTTFDIQIANGNESKKIDKVHLDSAYEFLFSKKNNEKNELVFDNSTMIAYSRIALPNYSSEIKANQNKKEQKNEEKLQKSA